jgi:NadR type nicotinamide-nucleotide adenylyltransferase
MLNQPTLKAAKNIKTACVIGPECTGKTDLARFLAAHYAVPWVQEYARAYLEKLGRKYQEFDLLKIGHGQIRMEDEWKQDADKLLICDTNLLVIKIWSEFKYGKADPEIERIHAQRTYDLYLLTYIDVPWEEDPQREHPQERERLWEIYRSTIMATGVPVVEIRGARAERQELAVQAIDRLLSA